MWIVEDSSASLRGQDLGEVAPLDEQTRLGERMIATWTRFARTGNPGWERVRAGDANVRSIKPGCWVETEFVRDHELAFWRSL